MTGNRNAVAIIERRPNEELVRCPDCNARIKKTRLKEHLKDECTAKIYNDELVAWHPRKIKPNQLPRIYAIEKEQAIMNAGKRLTARTEFDEFMDNRRFQENSFRMSSWWPEGMA